MAQMLEAPIEGYEDAIVVPPINANNFELKQTLINLVQNLLRQCPHHGFSKLHQLDTFYNALNPNDQDALDSAAGGNFLDKIPRECLAIIESKSKVRYSRSRVTDSRVSTNAPLSSSSSPSHSFDLQQIAASLEDKLDIRMNRFEESLNDKKAFVTSSAPINAEVKNVVEQPAERRTRIEKSLQNFRVIHKSSISLKNTSKISPVHAIASILSTKVPEYSLSMGYEHPNTTLETESNEIIKSDVKELVPIPHERELLNKVDFIDAGVSDFYSEEIKNFLNNDSLPIGIENYVFNMEEDILYLESLLSEYPYPLPSMNPNQEKSSIEEPEHSFSMGYEHFSTTLVTELDEVAESSIKNLVPIPHECEVTSDNESESNELVKYNSSAFTTFPNLLFNHKDDVTIHEDDVPIEESKDYSNPLFNDDEINSDELESHVESNFVESLSNHDTVKFNHLEEFSRPLMPIHIAEEERIRREHADYLSRFENDDSEEENDVVHDLHVDNSISNSENELSDNEASDFDNPSIPRPPLEPPDAEFEKISVVMNTIVKFECLNPRDEFDVFNDESNDYFPFMFVIRIFRPYLICSKVFSFLLFAESEDTIFDPGISV
nr:reverse transcriptase domain-containing protein [Tanacetum cinerariifolium]